VFEKEKKKSRTHQFYLVTENERPARKGEERQSAQAKGGSSERCRVEEKVSIWKGGRGEVESGRL